MVRRAWQVFLIPLLLGVITVIGLLSALLGDHLWDALSWLTLGLICGVMVWYWFFARYSRRD